MVYGAFWGKIFLKSYLIKIIKKWAKGDDLIFKGSFKFFLTEKNGNGTLKFFLYD